MKAEKYFEKHKHLQWLEQNAREYKESISFIEKEYDNFVVEGVLYTARSNERVMRFNSHHSINPKFILDGLREVLQTIEKEINDLKGEIGNVVVEL